MATDNERFVTFDDDDTPIEDQSVFDKENEKWYYVDYFDDIIGLMNKMNDEIKVLQKEVDGAWGIVKSYRKTVRHDAVLLADATKKGYLPPMTDEQMLEIAKILGRYIEENEE